MPSTNLPFAEGLLEPGTHVISREDFIDIFCSDNTKKIGRYQETYRSQFHKPFQDIVDWAKEAGATSIIIGGSFISQKEHPSDIDIIILFSRSGQIPKSSEKYDVNGVMLDIQLLSEDQPNIVAAYLELLSTTRQGVPHGLIQIKIHPSFHTLHSPAISSPDLEIVKTAYLGRRWSREQTPKGVIVPIHGIRTHAESWLPNLCLSASTAGWAIAPYIYGYQNVTVLRDKNEKTKIVEGLRDWLIQIRRQYDGPISIIAHSFGTYVIGRYLLEAEGITHKFDAIILCGSILSKEYNWQKILADAVVGRVLNTISSNDEWVKFLPEGGVAFLAKDPLFGKAGCEGFSAQHPHLKQINSHLLTHNNIFKDDVILGEWLPFLELAKGSQYRGEFDKFIDLYRRD